MDKKIFTAKTYDDAVTKALIELGTTQDKLDIKVLEEGSSGLFGIFGAKPYKIEVQVIQEVDDFELLRRENKLHSEQLIHSLNATTPAEKEKASTTAKKVETTQKIEPEKKPRVVKEHRPDTQKASDSKVNPTDLESRMTTKPQKNVISMDMEDKAAGNNLMPLSNEDAAKVMKKAENFVAELLKTMNFDVQVTSSFDHSTNEIYMLVNSEDDMGIIIGKRGQTLDSIQYITSLVINKTTTQYIRVKLDAQGYREKRKEKLENLANSVALKVKRFRKPISLEPMNPYERRIIHSALQSHPYIITKSEGEDPNRFITIMPKNNRNRYPKNSKFRKPQDRNYRNSGEFRE